MIDVNDQVWSIGCGTGSGAAPATQAMGFKAYNLWRMQHIGLPVPQAFVLGTGFCQDYFRADRSPVRGLQAILASRMRDLEKATGLGFGSVRKPLLVSVRSGAPVSMPGMLETVLDIGICDATVPGLLRLTGNPRLVWDSYRRLVCSFAEVVHRLPGTRFDQALAARLEEAGVTSATELDFQSLRALTRDCLDIFEELAGHGFPQQPHAQLEAAVIAVWESWSSEKAVQYRQLNGLSDELGTAVTVQRMVFGNGGGTSGSGVAFTRDPTSGERTLYLDFMFNAQGEDVVAGRRNASDGERLIQMLPAVFQEIAGVARLLEQEFQSMQEFEFTVQDARLYVLQTRTGKCTPWAALRIAVDQVAEGLIDSEVALRRLAELDLDRIERLRIASPDDLPALCKGIPSGIGVAVGEIALDAKRAESVAKAGRSAILVRERTSTEDIAGMHAAAGILTATGSRTSHAAVVARQMNKACIVGCEALVVDATNRHCALAGRRFAEGDVLSIDSQSGDVFPGAVTVVAERPAELLARVAEWRSTRAAA